MVEWIIDCYILGSRASETFPVIIWALLVVIVKLWSWRLFCGKNTVSMTKPFKDCHLMMEMKATSFQLRRCFILIFLGTLLSRVSFLNHVQLTEVHVLFSSTRFSMDAQKQTPRKTSRLTQGVGGIFPKVSKMATNKSVLKHLSTVLIVIKDQFSWWW